MIQIDSEQVTQYLRDLVAIDSVNPACDPAGKGEGEISAYLAWQMRALGLDVERTEIQAGRYNVVGVLHGNAGGNSLMWNAHTDTVGAGGMRQPFTPKLDQGKCFGRGAIDMKASLAGMLAAVKGILKSGTRLEGDLILAAVADEEWGSLGTEALMKTHHATAAIVTEPTDLRICLAHRGYIHYRIETTGKAAHGSRYDQGVDANLHMGRFLCRLETLEQELRGRPPHPLVGTASLHAALLQGGSEMSVYAAHCELNIERRTLPGELEGQVTQEFQTILDELALADPKFSGRLQEIARREPFEVSREVGIVRCLENAAHSHLGESPGFSGQWFWTDAALLAGSGIETVVFGPVGGGLHADEEWVEIDSVVKMAGVLADTALDYCNGGPG
jgi:acetylornithine deacetylase